jgi:hypothetical protein
MSYLPPGFVTCIPLRKGEVACQARNCGV